MFSYYLLEGLSVPSLISYFYNLPLNSFVRKSLYHLEKFFAFVIAIILLMFITESWPQFMGLYILLALAVNARNIESKLSQQKYNETYCRIAYRA